MKDINPDAVKELVKHFDQEQAAYPLMPPGFGFAREKHEGQGCTFDDGIALMSAAHPVKPPFIQFRNRIADGLVWLAEAIGDQQFYGREK